MKSITTKFFLIVAAIATLIFSACNNNDEKTVDPLLFTQSEKELILNGDTASMLPVIFTTNPEHFKILKSVSKDIAHDDTLLPVLVQRMYLAMTDSSNPGVGIAAPQVGINRNIIWVQRLDKENETFEYYLNPKITWHSNLIRNGREGCLSIPDTMGMVDRYYTIQITYQNSNGENISEIVEGFTVVIFQHEIDHLNGILFTDRLQEQATREYTPINDVLKIENKN